MLLSTFTPHPELLSRMDTCNPFRPPLPRIRRIHLSSPCLFHFLTLKTRLQASTTQNTTRTMTSGRIPKRARNRHTSQHPMQGLPLNLLRTKNMLPTGEGEGESANLVFIFRTQYTMKTIAQMRWLEAISPMRRGVGRYGETAGKLSARAQHSFIPSAGKTSKSA